MQVKQLNKQRSAMRTTRTTPDWAIELVTEVCRDYNRALPKELKWFRSDQSNWTSGWTARDGSRIFIRAGRCGYDQELVLLHELAHHIICKTKAGRKMTHSIKFWKLAFELYRRYGMNLGYAFYREETYRKKAEQAYEWILAQE
jgi:hypothetical protein